MKTKFHFWYFFLLLLGFSVIFLISCDDKDDGAYVGDTKVVEVTNPATGKTWMDRNLGASRAATSPTDASSFGDLYQWGRGADGHQLRSSDTTSVVSRDRKSVV